MFALAWAFPAAKAPAVTWDVPADAASVAAGLAAASPGDTVLVAPGTWNEHDLALPGGVTLRGAGAVPSAVTIDALGLGRVLDATGVTGVRVENLTLRGGSATSGAFFGNAGGGMRCDSSEVALTDCVLRDHRAIFGAGLAARGSALAIENCRFEADSALSPLWAAGGGMYAQGCTGTVNFSVFERNAAFGALPPGDGGGVFADECELVFADCSFSDNAAGAGAGALYSFFRDRSAILRCTFLRNTAPGGGAIYVENSYTAVRECTFEDNTAQNGGAVFLGERAFPVFADCRFDANVATPNAGGAVDCWVSDPVFARCVFADNTAGRGGAFAAHGASAYAFTDCTFLGNSASLDGGTLRGSDASAGVLTRCSLLEGGAPTGGGIALIDTADLGGAACLVAFATSGGAASCGGSATVTFTGSDVFGNAGGDWTGCLAGQSGVAGNFSLDPLLCPSNDGSLALPDSPCLAENSPSGAAVGARGAGCGCPGNATLLVPAEFATIAAALAAASPGDVVGVCSGEYTETLTLREGVHLAGARADLVRIVPASAGPVLLRAAHVADSTRVRGLTLDGENLVANVVVAESLSTGLALANCVVTGATSFGVVNGADSRITLGGSLEFANDILGNGGLVPRNVRNLNTAADSIDATRNHWGALAFDGILAALEGEVRVCPITNALHEDELCGPLSALAAPHPAATGAPRLAAAPNPFAGETLVSWTGVPPGPLTVRIYDVAGRRVRTLSRGSGEADAVVWTGRDDAGRAVAPGVYFVRLEGAGTLLTRKVVRLR